MRYTARNVVARGLRFNVLDWGSLDAPPIVCLHGNHQSAHSWYLVSLHHAANYRVITPDQRGHGDSEWARDCDYSTDAMAADAIAIMQALELTDPIVMGHSMGGRNTLVMALDNPHAAKALVIVDVGPELSERGRKIIGSFIQANEEFDDIEAFVTNVRNYDPYRSRQHIERTVKYNLFQRADGKFVSKCDRAPRRLADRTRWRSCLDIRCKRRPAHAGTRPSWRNINDSRPTRLSVLPMHYPKASLQSYPTADITCIHKIRCLSKPWSFLNKHATRND